MVERAHGDHDADRFTQGERDPARRCSVDVHRHDMTCFEAQDLGAMEHAVDRARDFDARVVQRLAAFARRLERQRFCALFHQPCGGAQNLDPARRRKPGVSVAEQRVRLRQGALHVLLTSCRQRGDQRAVERGADLFLACHRVHSGDFIAFRRAVSNMFSL